MNASRHGLSLIEVTVVIAVVGLLLALALPAIQYSRESARNAECKSKLHQLGIALEHHHSQSGAFPKDGDRGWGYAAHLLPEMGEKPLYEQLNTQANLASSVVLKVFLCPSFPGENHLPHGEGRSNYRGSAAIFGTRTVLSDIYDGESNTIAVGETTTDLAWALPGIGKSDARPNTGGDFGSAHHGGTNFLLCDGSVKFVADTISGATFSALCTPAGRETLGEY